MVSKGVALPRFSECFRERTEAAWEKFAQQEAQLRQRMDEDKDHQRGMNWWPRWRMFCTWPLMTYPSKWASTARSTN